MHYTIEQKRYEHISKYAREPTYLFIGQIEKKWFIDQYGAVPALFDAMIVLCVERITFLYVG